MCSTDSTYIGLYTAVKSYTWEQLQAIFLIGKLQYVW